MKQISDELFNELKQSAIDIWSEYDDEFGYVTEKINRVNSIKNVSDNYGTFIGMFDTRNQVAMYEQSSDGAKALIDEWTGGLDKLVKLAKDMGVY